MPLTIGHVGLCVPDIRAAIDWYCDVLTLELIAGPLELQVESPNGPALRDVFGAGFSRALIAHLGAGGETGLELFEFIDPAASGEAHPSYFRFGVSHLCFVSDDLEGTIGRVVRRGGRVRTDVWHEDPGLPYRYVHFEDPFANLLELHSHPYRDVMARPGASGA